MVHALEEIRRVLIPKGVLIDLRPYADHWPVEIIMSQNTQEIGRVADLPQEISDDHASDEALEQAAEKGWLVIENRDSFPFSYYWDTPNEMAEYISTEWEGFIMLGEDLLKAVRSAWVVADADARVRINLKMLIARWRKQVT